MPLGLETMLLRVEVCGRGADNVQWRLEILTLALGILVAAVAAFCMNFGIFLAKREVDRLPRLGVHSFGRAIKAFFTSPRWLKSQGIQFMGGGLHVLAIALAPLSVVQPIGAAGVIFLVFLTVAYLGEKAEWIDWVGVSVIVLGLALLGVSMVKATQPFSYRPVVSWFFIAFLLGVVAFSFWLAFRKRGGSCAVFSGIGLGVLIGLNAILIKLAINDVSTLYHQYHLAAVLHSSFLFMAIIGSLIAEVFFQAALQRGKALLTVPLITGLSNMIPIMVGVLALKEPFPTDPKMMALRLLSFTFIISGAVVLSLQGVKQQPRQRDKSGLAEIPVVAQKALVGTPPAP